MYKRIFKIVSCFIIPICAALLISYLGAILVLKTEISQSIESLIAIIAVSLGCLLMSVLLTLNTKIKGIYCVVISFVYFLILKLMSTLLIVGKLNVTGQGVISILFIALFCFIGGIIGSNLKK